MSDDFFKIKWFDNKMKIGLIKWKCDAEVVLYEHKYAAPVQLRLQSKTSITIVAI